MHIKNLDPKSLRLHKLRAHLPKPDKQSPEWAALSDSVAASGILQPLLITPEGLIADGGWRWEAARDWQLATVPCLEITEDQVPVVICETLIARKQMTRGAAVYLMLGMIPDYAQAAETRRLNNLKRNRATNEVALKAQCLSNPSNLDSGESMKALCARWGITDETFLRAREVRSLLHNHDCKALAGLHKEAGVPLDTQSLQTIQRSLRTEFEPKLLNGEMNLWNVRSAIAGRIHTKDLPKKQPQQLELELFSQGLLAVCTAPAGALRPAIAAAAAKADSEGLDRLEEAANLMLAEVGKRRTKLKAA